MRRHASTSFANWGLAALAGLIVISAPLLAAFEPVGPGDEAAILYPAGWPADRAFSAAAGAAPVIRFGAFDNIAIVRIDADEQIDALRRSGALLILNADGAASCLAGAPVQSRAL